MATTDSNGILQLEVSDPVVPLQTALNGIGASVSSAMDSTVRTFKVANATARNNLATQRTPSKSDPLRVWRQDTGVYEINDGTGWRSETPAELDPNIIRIDGADYQRTGTLTATPSAFTAWAGLYYATVTIPDALKTAPTGWTYAWTLIDGGNGSYWMGGKTDDKNQFILSAATVVRTVVVAWQLVKI